MEMHMVHIEDEFVRSDGSYDLEAAKNDKYGLAVLAIFFDVDNDRAMVNP